jgi:hypothetical protein
VSKPGLLARFVIPAVVLFGTLTLASLGRPVIAGYFGACFVFSLVVLRWAW